MVKWQTFNTGCISLISLANKPSATPTVILITLINLQIQCRFVGTCVFLCRTSGMDLETRLIEREGARSKPFSRIIKM